MIINCSHKKQNYKKLNCETITTNHIEHSNAKAKGAPPGVDRVAIRCEWSKMAQCSWTYWYIKTY